jgi:hypothetical protein
MYSTVDVVGIQSFKAWDLVCKFALTCCISTLGTLGVVSLLLTDWRLVCRVVEEKVQGMTQVYIYLVGRARPIKILRSYVI